MKTMIKTAIATGLLVAGMSVAYANVTLTASADVVDTSGVVAPTDAANINFGTITLSDINSPIDITINPGLTDNLQDFSGVTGATVTGAGRADLHFTGGTDGRVITVTAPDSSTQYDLTATNGSTGVYVTAITLSNSGQCTIAGGSCDIYAGGTLHLPAKILPGNYTTSSSISLTQTSA